MKPLVAVCNVTCTVCCCVSPPPNQDDVNGLSSPTTDEKPPECDKDVSEKKGVENNENEVKGSPSLGQESSSE